VSPFILLTGCLIINRDVTGWLCCSLGTTDCLRIAFTSLPLQRHHMWSKYMRCVDGICGQQRHGGWGGPRGETALTNNNHGKR